MAEDIKFSQFQKATQSKDTDELAILQDGVNKMIPSPVLESKIINKTVSRVINQGGASLNIINLIGVVPTYADLASLTPNLNDAYQVEADGLVYVYTESGFQADGEGVKVQPDVNGVVEEGNQNAVSGGEVYQFITDKSVLNGDFEVTTSSFNEDGVLISSSVVWSDGTLGELTPTDYNEDFLTFDGYRVSYKDKFFVQNKVSRGENGEVINKPLIVIE